MELTNPARVVTGYRADQLNAQEQARSHYFESERESFARLLAEGLPSD